MGAKYTSPKPDGYLSTRNNVCLERESQLQKRTFELANACRDLPEQNKENYGKKDISREMK